MKPIKPYADYYINNNNLDNCTNSRGDAVDCRYIRVTGDSCESLDTTYTYSDSNFTNLYQFRRNVSLSDNQIISTNCSNLNTNNYNPGSENILMTNFATIIAILIISLLIYGLIKLVRIPSIWSRSV